MWLKKFIVMRKYKQRFRIIVLAFLLVPFIGASQTNNDAITAYNEGAQLINSDPANAIKAFEKCINLCDAIGTEADETRMLAETQLPGLHYKIAMELYKQKKLAEAIDRFEKTGALAEKYNNSQITKKVNKVVPQLYMIQGNSQMKQNPQEALKNLNKATEMNPALTKAFLAKGLIYKDLDDETNMKVSLDKTIEVGFAHNDIKTATQAEKMLRNFYFNKAVKAIQVENITEAEAGFKSTIEYGSKESIVYYQLGKIYNVKKQYEIAVQTLNRAVEFEKGGDEEKAKIFYEIGNSYLGLGKNSEACNAYKKALFGDYAEGAKYQIEEVLKCN